MDNTPALRAVAEVEVPVTATLAEMHLSLEEIVNLRPGATLNFPQRADAPLSLEVDGVPIGIGQAVERSGQIGFRLERLAVRPPPASS